MNADDIDTVYSGGGVFLLLCVCSYVPTQKKGGMGPTISQRARDTNQTPHCVYVAFLPEHSEIDGGQQRAKKKRTHPKLEHKPYSLVDVCV